MGMVQCPVCFLDNDDHCGPRLPLPHASGIYLGNGAWVLMNCDVFFSMVNQLL